MSSQISRRSFFDVWFANAKESRNEALLYHVLQELGDPVVSEDQLKSCKATISRISEKINQRWTKSGRHWERFLRANSSWLEENISFSGIFSEVIDDIPVLETRSQTGRPLKDFESSSDKTKRRRVQSLLETTSTEELSLATEVKLRQSGKRDSAAIVKELCLFSPKRGTEIKKVRKSLIPKQSGLLDDQALALMIDSNLSTHQYEGIRKYTKEINRDMFPPYYKVKAAKKLCYPSEINVTETHAEVELQSLMDHTVKRLCKAQEEVLQTITDLTNLEIIVKWGCDGAEQNRYKQKFSEENSSDESMFSISMVPIQMYSVNEQSNIGQIVWQNPSTSSTKYCRPIKFVFAKETADLIVTEVDKIKEQVTSLVPTKIVVNDMEILVKPILIDGKICNAVASCASTQTCYLCGAKPSEMNN